MADNMGGVQSHAAAEANGGYTAWLRLGREGIARLTGWLRAAMEELDAWLITTWAVVTTHPFAAAFIAFLVSLAIVTSPLLSESVRTLLVGDGKDISTIDVVNKIGLLLGGVIGFALTVWRVWCVDRQTKINDRIHVTDRFLKASEQLGSPEMAVRLGGVFSLWAAGRDSAVGSEKIAVLDILCAFIRKPTKDTEPDLATKEILESDSSSSFATETSSIDGKIKIRIDVDSALKLLVKGGNEFCDSGYCADISGADVRFCSILNAIFFNCNLDNANFSRSKIVSSQFKKSSCDEAVFENAVMRCVDFEESMFIQADFNGAVSESSIYCNSAFIRCKFDGADFDSCDMSDSIINSMTGKNVKIANSTFFDSSLIKCQISESSFNNSKFKRVVLDNTVAVMSSFVDTDFSKLRCKECHFFKNDFSNTDFSGGHFADTSLIFVNVCGCDFTDVVFENCIFVPERQGNAKFVRTDFRKAQTIEFTKDISGMDGYILYETLKDPKYSWDTLKRYGCTARPLKRSDFAEGTVLDCAIFQDD